MKIICIGMNYAAHNAELQCGDGLIDPVVFLKPDTALLNNGKPFFIPDFSDNIHYETEIVVRINRLGRNIAERFARRYYNEVTVGIDFTARDLQERLRRDGMPWEICKSFDYSAAVGDFISLEETGRDIQDLDFHLDINGRTVQSGHTGNMLNTVDKIIAYTSRFFTLRTGDLIYTGTPEGVGKVNIDDRLEGYIGDRRLFAFNVK